MGDMSFAIAPNGLVDVKPGESPKANIGMLHISMDNHTGNHY